MDIKTLLNNLHEEVSCSVCMTTFTDPKQLPCLHSFCLHCLNGTLRTSGRRDVITCPECRRESRVPRSGNLKHLPTNFRINSLLDVLAIKQCSTTGVKCGNCDNISVQSCYCFQCCVFWCDDCITTHNIIRANKEHRVLALTDFKDEDFENILKRPAFCEKKLHEKDELKFFCKICETPICNACALTDHEGHAKILLEEAANERNSERIGSLKTFFSRTSAHQSRAEGKGKSEAIVGLEAQFVLTTRNAEGEQYYDEGDRVTVETGNCQGQECATKVRVQDNKDGTYKINYFAKETGKCDVSVTVNEQHVHGSPFAVEVKPRQFRPVLSFGQEDSAVGKLSNPWGVAVNERNEIAVTDYGNNRIQVFNSDGTYLRSFGRKGDKQGEFDYPFGIGFDKNVNIIVADCNNHRVQCFHEQGEYLHHVGSHGNLDYQLGCPHGLSIDNDGNIIVADRKNKLIKIFYPNGKFSCTIGKGCFTFPIHCVQYENYLIASDCDEHCLKSPCP